MYVLQNARKHQAWIARFADIYSSGPTFDGWRERRVAESRAGVGGSAATASTAGVWTRARTWLLTTGWRKLGLIGLLELPRGAARPLAARTGA